MVPELKDWDSFYLIVASAAGALIGLQFVVMTLIAERPPPRVAEAAAAFATPTIVHFCVVLLVSALLRAPWQSIRYLAVLWGIIGIAGFIYAVIVARRIRTQTTYAAQIEDWAFHFILPLFAYAVLVAAAVATTSYAQEVLFSVGAAILLLLSVGIHNAWDAVAYHVLVARLPSSEPESK